MSDEQCVTQLYPQLRHDLPLAGLYLDHDLRRQAERVRQPFVVANFVTSLDGRIAVPRDDGKGLAVPESTANDRDWRLFQELAIQADVIISSGRYLRDYAAGRAQEILRVYDDPRFEDLHGWRADRGLPPQPALAVISNSLDFPIPPVLAQGSRDLVVFTGAGADPARVRELERQSSRVIVADEEQVTGRWLVEAMATLGYQTIYSAAGPRVLHMLLAGQVLERLYLTMVGRLIGGAPYAGIVDGALLDTPVDMRLHSMYHDIAGAGQLFMCYERQD
ncbi:MAG: dihydrofolate reductase family protein [Caldilineae bacterium]|nr:dihydrofolate reductase family protein [Anaerolineae bacterium]MCB0201937.1 dihydrofolate reductase family protein [Anaerolineae bacterium]MCB9152762.1 dihydrofolate reductase family protein [Caldilineae bacterium]